MEAVSFFFNEFVAKCMELFKGDNIWDDPFPPVADGEFVIGQLTREEWIFLLAIDNFNCHYVIICSSCGRQLSDKNSPQCQKSRQIQLWLPILRQIFVTMISDRLQIANNLFAIRRDSKIVQTNAEKEQTADAIINFQCPPDE